MNDLALLHAGRQPGAGLERLRRRLRGRDDWMFDEETFAAAVGAVGDEFVDGVLATPYDGSMLADRAISGFTSRWIDHLITSVRINPDPHIRSGYVCMNSRAWHEVSVLKFVNAYFILERPDLAMLQRGQEQTIEQLVTAFDDWLSDRTDAGRAPRRLIDLVNAADVRLRARGQGAPRLARRTGLRRRTGPDGPRPRDRRLRQQPDRRSGGGLQRPAGRGLRSALGQRAVGPANPLFCRRAGARQNGAMVRRSDQVRVVLVAATAVAQVVSSPLTTLALGPSSNTGAISDANVSPVTPAGYAFAIWGLIYLASLALAVYQASARPSTTARCTGAAAGGSSPPSPAARCGCRSSAPRLLWLSQIVIIMLVVCLVFAARGFTGVGPAVDTKERVLLRLPVTIYLGWAALATAAGFGTTLRSLGMPKSALWVEHLGVVFVLSATIASLFVVTRLLAVVGFVFTACWALVAVSVATYVDSVRLAAVIAIVVIVSAVVGRTLRSPDRRAVLLG